MPIGEPIKKQLKGKPKTKAVNEQRVVDKLTEEPKDPSRKLHGQLRELHVQPREPKELEAARACGRQEDRK
eukprot:11226026-Ditylum_brightwellii.AAC.1